MKLEHKQDGNVLELKLTGRLDAYWAGFLDTELEKFVRNGNHLIALNMSGIEYISSAGLRILLKSHNKLNALEGLLSIREPSQNVLDILNLTGFSDILKDSLATNGAKEETDDEIHGDFKVEALKCKVKGCPALCTEITENEVSKLEISDNFFSIGIGAFGMKNYDFMKRLGEYISVNGTVACLPTDSGHEPDFQLSSGDYVPDLQTSSSISCQGTLGISFVLGPESLGLSEIAELCFTKTQADTVGFVAAGELSGIAGAFLKKSPALVNADNANIFHFPEIRDWLSFTPEKAHKGEIALIAGVATKNKKSKLMEFLKPIDRDFRIYGHAHAAVFTYQPLKKGKITLSFLVRKLFEEEKLTGLYHLINDRRLISGAGETVLTRGLCWTAPVGSIEVNTEGLES